VPGRDEGAEFVDDATVRAEVGRDGGRDEDVSFTVRCSKLGLLGDEAELGFC
jgi:hypothetical protein